MKKGLMALAFVVAGTFLAASPAHAQLGTATGTTTLTVNVAAEAGLTVGSTPAMTSVGTNFSSYTATTSLTYYIRTATSGTITLKVTSDFSGVGGPSVGTPPTAGDALTYTSTINNPGNNGTATSFSNQTSSTAASSSVATFGADARSLFAGNTGTVAWTLTNDPKYKTGSYSATVTFTISAS